jgi:hypothetical protein
MGKPISSMTADGERAFISDIVLSELDKFKIDTYFIKIDCINHIRMVDNVFKTI